MLDQGAQQTNDRVGLRLGSWTQVDPVEVERSEVVECGSHIGRQPYFSGGCEPFDRVSDEGFELGRSAGPAPLPHRGGQLVGGDNPCVHRIFEVVADVGDAVRPGHDLALERGGDGPAPGVVADSVEGFFAQIERGQRDVGTPDGVVEPLVQVRRERFLAGMAARPVAAVVAQRDRLGQCHVEAACTRDRGGHLGHLERVREPRAQVVRRKNEHLGLPGKPSEGVGVQDAIAIALEAGAVGVGLLDRPPCSRPLGTGREGR